MNPDDETPVGKAKVQLVYLQRRYQKVLDDLTPHTTRRWLITLFTAIAYIVRVVIAQGWYVVTYSLGIYLLQMWLAFITPKFDPALEELERQDSGELPTRSDDEFKPFIRRLPEFKFWLNTTRAFALALFCSMFKTFDIPVFWPILLIYWIMLVFLTMRKQIQHMIRYKYVPFNLGKKRYSTVQSFKPSN